MNDADRSEGMKRIVAFIVVFSMLLCSCSKSTATEEEIKLADNQSMVIGKITDITGNDMTISLVEEQTVTRGSGMGRGGNNSSTEQPSASSETDNQTTKSGTESTGTNSDTASNGNSDQGMPSDENGGQGMPSDANGGQGMPSGGNGGPGMSEDDTSGTESDSNSSKDSESTETKTMTMYVATGETASYRIPVGTTVTTSLGTKTTFSRLAADDTIKIVTEKDDSGNDVIVAIWIVG